MNLDPYKAPVAELDSPFEIDIPERVLRKIRNGWIAGAISGCLSLGYMIFAFYTGEASTLTDALYLYDAILLFWLAYGVYKKSRTAATVLFLYDGSMKVLMAVETNHIGAIAIALLFLLLFFLGMIGTYQYHRMKNTHNKRMQSDRQTATRFVDR
jgi:hypothetical protein